VEERSSGPDPDQLLRRAEDKPQATGQRLLEKLRYRWLSWEQESATATESAVPVENQFGPPGPPHSPRTAPHPAPPSLAGVAATPRGGAQYVELERPNDRTTAPTRR